MAFNEAYQAYEAPEPLYSDLQTRLILLGNNDHSEFMEAIEEHYGGTVLQRNETEKAERVALWLDPNVNEIF